MKINELDNRPDTSSELKKKALKVAEKSKRQYKYYICVGKTTYYSNDANRLKKYGTDVKIILNDKN